jgi:hypothetical protein
MSLFRPRAIVALFALAALSACTGADQAEELPTPPVAEVVKPEPAQLSPADLAKAASNIALVPSPAEMQRALEAAGIQAKLGEKVPNRTLKMDVPNKDQVAVRTGVILADLLLTVKTAEKDALAKQLMDIKTGMKQLGAGSDISATVQDIHDRVMNDAVSRDDLVKELDELSGAIIPEIEYEAGPRSVPLIQAGSWLGGANLVAGAVIDAGSYDKAGDLLKQPAVVNYFQGYVKGEGQDKASGEVIAQLETSLNTLAEICTHETLSEEDVKTIQSSTASVLDLL